MLAVLRIQRILLNVSDLKGSKSLNLEIECNCSKFTDNINGKCLMSGTGTKGFRSSRAKRSLRTRVIKEVFTEAGADRKGHSRWKQWHAEKKEAAI